MSKSLKKPEREVSVSSLLWYIASKWRNIIICMLIFAVLFVGFKMFSSMQQETADVGATETEKNILTRYQEKEIESAWIIEKQIEDKENYCDNSMLMKIDPYNKNLVTLQFYVDALHTINLSQDITRDVTGDIVQAYVGYIDNHSWMTEVSGDNAYIYELVSCKGMTDAGSFVVYITGVDQDEIEKLADELQSAIQKYQENISEKIGSHDLKLIDREASVVADSSLANMQDNLNSTISSLYSQLETFKSALTDEQLKVFQHEENEGIVDQEGTTANTKVGFQIKYAVYGLVLGIFACLMWLALVYILGQRVRESEEINQMFNLRIWGQINKIEPDKSGLFTKLDAWIGKHRYGAPVSVEESLETAAANIEFGCRRQELNTIALASATDFDDEHEKMVENLIAKLQNKGVKVLRGKNLGNNISTLKLLEQTSHVVLVEEINKTKYSDIALELKVCSEQEATVVGAIVLE